MWNYNITVTEHDLYGVGNILGKLVTGIIDRFNSSEIVRNGASQKLNEVSQSVTGPLGILGVKFS